MVPHRRLIVFARFPVPGRVKTRLVGALGEEGAVALYRRLLLLTLRRARAFCEAHNVELEVRFDGAEGGLRHWLGENWAYRPQGPGDLGQRMSLAFAESAAEAVAATVIIGSDCPSLTEEVLLQAFSELKRSVCVFGPATDGGYYLVGLTKPVPELFRGVAWGTARAGAKVINSPRGRARQMNAGAALATGDVLVFLHADTRLPVDWLATVKNTLRQPGVAGGAFEFRIADDFRGKELVECFTNLRSRWFQNPYGDQTQFLRRTLFEEMGGFADMPLMEDYELNQRLRKRGKIVTARAGVLTSGRRWKKLGVFRTTLTNTLERL